MTIIKPTSGAMKALLPCQRNRVKKIIEDVRWFLKNGGDLTAYKTIWPDNRGIKKSVDTVVAIWSQLDSKERARLKKVQEQIKENKVGV